MDETKNIEFTSIKDLIIECRSRKEKGNKLYLADSPSELKIGIMDVKENEWLFLKLKNLRPSMKDLNDEERSIISTAFKTAGAKRILLSCEDSY